jgi:hypothetical protein
MSHCIVVADRVIVAVASDGAGSADFGGEGAVIVCRTVTSEAREHFKHSNQLPDEETVRLWIDASRDRIGAAASTRAALPRDFAATLIALIMTTSGGLILHVGDGGAVLRTGGRWVIGSWPANGEYASSTFFVTDSPEPQLRILPVPPETDAFAIFTDGLERLLLDFSTQQAHGPFFENAIRPLGASAQRGRDNELARALVSYLDSEAFNTRTDDDKTLILAINR